MGEKKKMKNAIVNRSPEPYMIFFSGYIKLAAFDGS